MGDKERDDVLAGGNRAVEHPVARVIDPLRILEYGPKAARGAEQAVAAAFKAINEFEPEFVETARAEWKTLLPELPRRNLMRNVTIEWLLDHPYAELRSFDIGAWTNSQSEIYVQQPPSDKRDGAKKERAYWRAVLYHEALHVEQFADNGGPPDTYTKMMDHEVEAYGDTSRWLRDTKQSDRYSSSAMEELTEKMSGMHTLFSEEKRMVERATPEHEHREEAYRDFLLGTRYSDVPAFLPSHDDLVELYGR